LSRSSR